MKLNGKSKPKVILDGLYEMILWLVNGMEIIGKNAHKLFKLATGTEFHRSS
jgi:hypothetical protein